MLSYIFLLIFVLGCSCQTDDLQTGSRNFNLIVTDPIENQKTSMKCKKQCINESSSIVMVQTAVSNVANINQNIDNYTAIVNYRCKNTVTMGELAGKQSNIILRPEMSVIYQSLCQNRDEFCKENMTGFTSHWKSIRKNVEPVLNVDIRLPSNADELRIKITKCSQEFMVFRFMVDDKQINYNDNPAYKYNLDVFSTTALDKSPLKLSIFAHPNGNVTWVVFNVAKSKCAYGWHEETDTEQGFKCVLNLDNKMVDGGYLSVPCPRSPENQQVTATNIIMRDVCALSMIGENRVCRDRCFNQPGCSYMCAVEDTDSGQLREGGYIMNATDTSQYPMFLGSGHWKVNELPSDLVLFDECRFQMGVCALGDTYCRDEDDSFSCTNGTYNLNNCLAAKSRYPYWRCPADDTAIMMVMRTPGLLKSQNDSIFYKNEIMSKYSNNTGSLKTIKLLYHIIKDFSTNKSDDAFNLPVKEKRSFASFLLNKFVDDYCIYSKTKISDQAFEDDSFFFSAVDIDEDKEEIDIKMSPETVDNETQFIKLELNKVDTRSNRKVRANYFQFKNMDIMDEEDAVKNNLENMRFIKDSKISPDDYDADEDGVLYKNSKMFTLKVDEINAVKSVKYKLKMTKEIQSYSWLYRVENVCGFLDENRNWTWSTEGCQLVINGTETYCQCNHLSNFAMLFSMKEVNKNHLKAFEVLSIIGGVINIVSLFLFLVFVLFINSREKLRIDQLNVAICIMLGTIVFLSGPLLSKNLKLCSAAAIVTQFLFLAAFVWKLILGINVVRLIASLRYQNEDWLVKYRWIMLVTGYSIPLVIVSISGGIYWAQYGLITDNVCWIDASSKAFLSFLIPVGLIIGVNTIGLFFIANTLIRNYINTHKTRMSDSNELIVFVQLLVSMGLTWLPSYFAIVYLSAMYLFVIFFPLQGLLMFLLVVVINKENREKVSSFIISNYNSITSKSTTVTEGQTNSRSKSSALSKGTESDNLLTGVDKTHDSDRERSEERLLEVPEMAAMGQGDHVTKC